MENRRIIRDMHCVSNKLSRQLDNLLSTQGITHMQFAILSFITRYTKDGKDVFQKNLEVSFDIRPYSVSSILSLMEEKKLIKRVSVKNDARLRKIILTTEGTKKYNDVHAKVIMFENKIKSLFSEDEIKVFFNVLDKLYDYTEE